jgi:hypothetical protein
LYKIRISLIISKALPLLLFLAFWVFIPIADVLFNFQIESLSNPKFCIRNSLIFTRTGNCRSVKTIENTGTRSLLHNWNEPSPSISPSNQ